MKQEIHFLFDDKLDQYLKGINEIISGLEKIDLETRKKEVILRTFTKSIIKSLMKPKPKEYKKEPEYRSTLKYPVTRKRLVHIPYGSEVWPIPQPTPETSKPLPIKEFKVIPKYVPRVIQSTEEKEVPQETYTPRIELKPQEISYTLTAEPGTNKALALAQVSYDYKVLEPLINEKDQELITQLKSYIGKKPQKYIDNDPKLTKIITKYCSKLGIQYSDDYKRKIRYYLIRDLMYFGKIDPILRDNKITKIICDGPGTPVLVEYDSRNLSTNIIFKDIEKINDLIKHIASKLDQKISESEPILDIVYKDWKIQATLGTAFSTPKFTIIRQKDMNLLSIKA